MKTLNEIVHTIAMRGGKDEDDAYLAMIESLVNVGRAKFLKQKIDRHGPMPWMNQTVRIPLIKDNTCLSAYPELISESTVPRTLRKNDNTFFSEIFLANSEPVLQIQESDDQFYGALNPKPIRAFIRNNRLVVRGNFKLKEVRVRDIFEDPLQIIGSCCDLLEDYTIHEDIIGDVINYVESLIYKHETTPEDLAEIRRKTGL